MSIARRCVLAGWLALSACATEEPVSTPLGPADEVMRVELLGDGFVRSRERRMPREAFVLELRQRVRPMPSQKVSLLRVEIAMAEALDDSASRDSDWLLDQLYIMGIGQVLYL